MALLYNLLLYLLSPFAIAFAGFRAAREPGGVRRLRERLGLTAVGRLRPVWIHCASLGEVQAAVPLIRALLPRGVLITTFTATGSARVRDLFGDSVDHCYLPFDLPGASGRFLDRVRPRVAVIFETELWPNLFSQCRKRDIPLVLLNARLSPRALKLYRVFSAFTERLLRATTAIAARSRVDAERFIALGASPATVSVAGDIKFDMQLPTGLVEAAMKLRRAWDARYVLAAGSTHAGEDEQVLFAFRRIREHLPEAKLILAPRHPERFEQVAALCRNEGYRVSLRSAGSLAPTDEVLLVDTLGELPLFYGASDVAVAGGSLVPVGGHNPLEPAALGVPVISGPNMFNFEEAREVLCGAGALRVVDDAEALAQAVLDWMSDDAARRTAGEAGRAAVRENAGAVDRLVALLKPYLC